MRIAALGVLRVVQLTRAEAGIAQNPLQGPWETKGAQDLKCKGTPGCGAYVGPPGLALFVRRRWRRSIERTGRSPFGPRSLSVGQSGANDSTPVERKR